MTFSLVACNNDEIGVATASHWIAVGAMVPWCSAAGAVATQAFTEPAYGPRCLQAMADGLSADAALEQVLAGDPGASLRQVAVIDAHGHTAHHTGSSCLPRTCANRGDGVMAVGNMLASSGVAAAMVEAFETACGSLASRLVAGLQAGEAAGGDARGRQAAALRTTLRDATPSTGLAAFEVDLRVDDHPNPIGELQRLYVQAAQYREIAACAFPGGAGPGKKPEATGKDSPETAILRRLATTATGEAAAEAALWLAVACLHHGDTQGAEAILQKHPELRHLVGAAVALRG